MRKSVDGLHRRPTVYEPCPYSPSCFTCPWGDCIAQGAYRYNALVDDREMLAVLGGERA